MISDSLATFAEEKEVILVKPPAIDPDYDPSIWYECVGLFEGFDVFVPTASIRAESMK